MPTKLIRITAPSDYIHKGRESWFNPSDVEQIGYTEMGTTFVKLRSGVFLYSDKATEEIIVEIERASALNTKTVCGGEAFH